MPRVMGRMPTIPEYYKEFIDSSVDLLSEPKQCCPFHNEDTPSFSYSRDKGVWRCFGGCHCGGDVIELHRKNYKLGSRSDAEKSLHSLYGVTVKRVTSAEIDRETVRDDVIEDNAIRLKALLLANCPDRWLELDYVMSKYPLEIMDIQELISRWEKG